MKNLFIKAISIDESFLMRFKGFFVDIHVDFPPAKQNEINTYSQVVEVVGVVKVVDVVEVVEIVEVDESDET